MNREQFRVTDVHTIALNGAFRHAFRVWKLDGDGFVHVGHFTAPIRIPKRDLLAFALEKIA